MIAMGRLAMDDGFNSPDRRLVYDSTLSDRRKRQTCAGERLPAYRETQALRTLIDLSVPVLRQIYQRTKHEEADEWNITGDMFTVP